MRNEDQNLAEFENEPVSQLLGSLKRVEAPGDFEFRVKARIAQGRPVEKSASLIPAWLRVAIPLALVVFVGGYFGFRSMYTPSVNDQPVAAVQPQAVAPAEQSLTVKPAEPASPAAVAKAEDKAADVSNSSKIAPPERLIVRTGSSDKNSGGGSKDLASKISKPILAKGLSPNKSTQRPPDFEQPANIPVKDVLSPIGIDVNYAGSVWTVGSVTQNSIAERAGMKTGDVIETIDDQSLAGKTTFGNNVSVKSIGIRRGGKSVKIELKP